MRESTLSGNQGPRHYTPRFIFWGLFVVVGMEGIEPSTSSLSVTRSTTELHAQLYITEYTRPAYRQAGLPLTLYAQYALSYQTLF